MDTLKIFNVSISNGNIKYPIEKSIFAVNLPLKLFPATVASADIRGLKSLLHSLKNVCTTKNRVLKTHFDKALAPF